MQLTRDLFAIAKFLFADCDSFHIFQHVARQQTCCLKQHVARNKQLVAGIKQLVARIKQHVACCPQQVARPRNLLPRNMLRWCKRGITYCVENWMLWTVTHSLERKRFISKIEILKIFLKVSTITQQESSSQVISTVYILLSLKILWNLAFGQRYTYYRMLRRVRNCRFIIIIIIIIILCARRTQASIRTPLSDRTFVPLANWDRTFVNANKWCANMPSLPIEPFARCYGTQIDAMPKNSTDSLFAPADLQRSLEQYTDTQIYFCARRTMHETVSYWLRAIDVGT